MLHQYKHTYTHTARALQLVLSHVLSSREVHLPQRPRRLSSCLPARPNLRALHLHAHPQTLYLPSVLFSYANDGAAVLNVLATQEILREIADQYVSATQTALHLQNNYQGFMRT